MFNRPLLVMVFLIGSFCQPSISLAENVRETPTVRAIQKSAPAVVNIGTEQLVLLGRHPVWGSYGGQLDQFYSEIFLQDQWHLRHGIDHSLDQARQ